MNDKISIIIPIYNSQKYLDKCLESCLKQTYKNFEIILVDDGSTDESGKLCDEYAKTDSRIKVYHKKNGGVSSARNLGLKNATGEYIVCVDSDDWINEDFLSRINLIGNEADFLIFGICFYFENYKIETIPSKNKKVFTRSEFLASSELYTYQSSLTGPVARVYKKSIIDSFNLSFDETMSFAEDSLFNIHYLERCNTVLMDENWFYNCNKNNLNSITHSVIKNQVDSRIKYLSVADDFFSKNMSESNYDRFVREQLYNLISSISYCFRYESDKKERLKVIKKIAENKFLKEHKINKTSIKQKFILFLLRNHLLNTVYLLCAVNEISNN